MYVHTYRQVNRHDDEPLAQIPRNCLSICWSPPPLRVSSTYISKPRKSESQEAIKYHTVNYDEKCESIREFSAIKLLISELIISVDDLLLSAEEKLVEPSSTNVCGTFTSGHTSKYWPENSTGGF